MAQSLARQKPPSRRSQLCDHVARGTRTLDTCHESWIAILTYSYIVAITQSLDTLVAFVFRGRRGKDQGIL